MVVSRYEALVAMKDMSSAEIRKELIDLGLFPIFNYILGHEIYGHHLKLLIPYTAHVYSYESKRIVINGDWFTCKMKIAKELGIPDHLLGRVVYLEDDELRTMFADFLLLHTEHQDYVQLGVMNEALGQLLKQATRFTPTEGGNDDSKKKFADLDKIDNLRARIKKLQDEVTDMFRILNKPKEDFKYNQVLHGNPLKLENSSQIRS